MTASLDTFPISGATVGSVLGSFFSPDQLWLLTDIETLADGDAIALGDLWHLVRSGPVTLSTRELAETLNLAMQVVSLDVRLKTNPSIKLLIEDGVKVECHLS
jgi:hypothetical protein